MLNFRASIVSVSYSNNSSTFIIYLQYLIAYAFLVFLDCMSENIIRDNVRGTDGYAQLVTKCEIMGKLAIPCSWKAGKY